MPNRPRVFLCHVCGEKFVLGGETGYDVYKRHLAKCRAFARPRRRRYRGKQR